MGFFTDLAKRFYRSNKEHNAPVISYHWRKGKKDSKGDTISATKKYANGIQKNGRTLVRFITTGDFTSAPTGTPDAFGYIFADLEGKDQGVFRQSTGGGARSN